MTTKSPLLPVPGTDILDTENHGLIDLQVRRLYMETKAHIKRVQKLAVILYQEGLLDSQIVSRADVEEYMSYHDAPKLMSLDQLKLYGYTHHQTLLERLSKHYGIGESEQLREISEELNRIEDILKDQYFSHLSSAQREVLREIERVADVTDTARHRSRELNFKAEEFGGAKYLESSGEGHLAAASMYLELNYLS